MRKNVIITEMTIKLIWSCINDNNHLSFLRMMKVQRKEDIIKDLYALECYLCDALNDRTMRKKIYTGGIFSPSTTAEWGDKAGFVAAKFIRFLVESGLSRPALRDKAVHAREKGINLQVDLEAIVKRMRQDEERNRLEHNKRFYNRV